MHLQVLRHGESIKAINIILIAIYILVVHGIVRVFSSFKNFLMLLKKYVTSCCTSKDFFCCRNLYLLFCSRNICSVKYVIAFYFIALFLLFYNIQKNLCNMPSTFNEYRSLCKTWHSRERSKHGRNLLRTIFAAGHDTVMVYERAFNTTAVAVFITGRGLHKFSGASRTI